MRVRIAVAALVGGTVLLPTTAWGIGGEAVGDLLLPVSSDGQSDHAIGANEDGSHGADAAESRGGPQERRAPLGRPVRVDMRRLAAAREEVTSGTAVALRLDLSDEVALTTRIERTAETRFGYSLWGRIEGQPHGSVTLVVNGDVAAGVVHAREGTFAISSISGSVYTVREVAGEFECGVEDASGHRAKVVDGASQRFTVQGQAQAGSAKDGDDGSEVDVLVLFTEAALRAEGGLKQMRASIDLAVAFTNDSYAASGVDFRLNLVAAVQVDYAEADVHGGAGLWNQDVDMARLIDPADGFMDAAHELRDRYAADIVHLVVDQSGGGGKGRILNPALEDPSAYAVSVSNSLSEWPAFLAHEAGHVMGLRHDRYVDPQPIETLHAYAHGYVNQRAFDAGAAEDRRWITIMAYNAQCRDAGRHCREIPRFSNPARSYPDAGGDPLGVAGDEPTSALDGPADAVRSLNERKGLIAGFRPSAERCAYSLSDERREIPASGGTFEVEVDTSCPWTATAFGDFLAIESEAKGTGTTAVTYRVAANDGPARVGHVVVAGETLSVWQSGAVALASVCDRSPPVRDALVEATARECGEVSEFDLLEVSVLSLWRQAIPEPKASDFAGLRHLVELDLGVNGIREIPDDAFRDLLNLKILSLKGNRLTAVPRAVAGLASLQELGLGDNSIADLRGNAFVGLSELRWLWLSGNDIADLPDGVFSGLAKLRYLVLRENAIAGVRKEALRGPEDLIRVDLSGNPLGTLREDAFANVRNVIQLLLDDTRLSAVPPATFTGMTRLAWLGLAHNRIGDLTDVALPGSTIGSLDLSSNNLRALPAGVFEDFTSPICGARNLDLDLSGNPGTPFPLQFELSRIDAGRAAPGPAIVVARIREGASWPVGVRVEAEDGWSHMAEIVNGDLESEGFEVAGDDRTTLRFAGTPPVPGSYKGVRIELGEPLRLFGLDDVVLTARNPYELDLASAFARPGETATFAVTTSAPKVAAVAVADGTLRVTPQAAGETTVTVTARYGDGTAVERAFTLVVEPKSDEAGTIASVPYFPSASDPLGRQGFARVTSHSPDAGTVSIVAIDDAGMRSAPLTLELGAKQTRHFNSDDLEFGNVAKGLTGSAGTGQGAWRVELTSDLDIEVLAYVRTSDGFLTAMHDSVPLGFGGYGVVTLNPGSNRNQESLLRIVNPDESAVGVVVRGTDDAGASPGGEVTLEIPAGESRTYTAAELESGSAAGLEGSLGDGEGKWRVEVDNADPFRQRRLVVMSLLSSPTGHLTNLSTAPGFDEDGDGVTTVSGVEVVKHVVPLFPSASDESGRQGFVRVANPRGGARTVRIQAYDESGRVYEPVTLGLEPGATAHFNSEDLEVGNVEKGLAGSIGAGQGDWYLELTPARGIEVYSYVRTRDGFLTAIHDTAAQVEGTFRVPTFNPGSNPNQVSVLRLVNAGAADAEATIRALDDDGASPGGPVRVTVPSGAVREYTAAELETGGDGFEGAIGDGAGKWRLEVESAAPLSVASLLESPTGHVTNLSTIPPRTRTETGQVPRVDAVHNDNVVVLRVGEDVTDSHSLRLDDYMRVFYDEFEDGFDFLMFLSNASDFLPGRPSVNYYSPMRNDVDGIGRPVSDVKLKSLLPSLSRLRGVIYLNNNEPTPGYHSLANGPSLHEIMHAWANAVVPTSHPSHWGFSSANGQLGGFDPATLEDLGGGRYAADFRIGGTRRPYSAIELYLAGYIGPEEVPDLSVAENAAWAREGGRIAQTADGKQIFTADRWRTYTIDDIVESHGPRVPTAAEAQWHFRTAVILLTDINRPGTPEELDLLSGHVERFSLRGSDDLDGYNNFHEATGGRGSVTMDGLSAFRRSGTETASPPRD